LIRRLTAIGGLAALAALAGGIATANASTTSGTTRQEAAVTTLARQDTAVRPLDAGGYFVAQGVHIHASPSLSSVVLGDGYESDSVTLHCSTDTNPYWGYLTDNTTGVTGYVIAGYYLIDDGQHVPFC
jgi:hypothetical protein